MSGDVQPRKRKDKKRKKDELGVEEPRGTAAVLGEGDVFMHSQHEHGTGGHWCAKIVFFSLLAVLVTLIGLIILENRGLTELEANSVESRYSGVLEGWLEDAPDDDHHDEHTLELLKHHEHEEPEEEKDVAIEVENLEKEVSDEDQPSQEEDNKSQEISSELPLDEVADTADMDSIEEEEFLEGDDIDDPLPVVERIVVPKGKPLAEVEDDVNTAKPIDTLAEEEEYEKQQEQLRQEQAQASHVWLKLVVGGALLVATHAVVSRAVAPRDDTPRSEGHERREETPSLIDRRMTLIPEDRVVTATPREIFQEIRPVIEEKIFEKGPSAIQTIQSHLNEDSDLEELEEEEIINDTKDITSPEPVADLETDDKELYSDDEEEADEDEDMETFVKEEKEISKHTEPIPKQVETIATKQKQVTPMEPEIDEDIPVDVEIIDEEQLEEELEEEEEDEEISDVDDAELLGRLEAKYGRLPEPERPGQKHKDGGNSIEDDWPGEPSDKYWRQQLDEAEQELRQDWLD